jgi:iron complex transport system ATP-binding protein
MSTLQISHLTCRRSGKTLLESVSATVHSGQVVALVGPNGSGKSTLLKGIAGVLSKGFEFSGSVQVDSKELLQAEQRVRSRSLVYLSADLQTLFPVTAREVVEMADLSRQGSAWIEQCMRRCQCWELRDRWVSSLSGGERQRVALARSMAQNAPFILLDESLSQLDLNHQRLAGILLREWAQQGKGIVWVAHDLNLGLAWATDAWLLNQGQLQNSGPVEKVVTASNLEALYPGANVTVENSRETLRVVFQK